MSEEKTAEAERPEERGRPGLRNLARRIFEGDREEDGREESEPRAERPAEERRTRELLISALATGDKAKTEIVRLIAREVRGYLEALELHKDLHYLLTNYSLDVQASFSLKPKSPAQPAPSSATEDEA
ncbi:MAG: hypothetical protein P8R54_12720 [Myxococcota bacterium]|nr:hypothetical protein [Myxococcota bacterium]